VPNYNVGEPVEVRPSDAVPAAYRGKRGIIRTVLEPQAPLFEVKYALDLVGSDAPVVMAEAWLSVRS
jgi:hypothetical protein